MMMDSHHHHRNHFKRDVRPGPGCAGEAAVLRGTRPGGGWARGLPGPQGDSGTGQADILGPFDSGAGVTRMPHRDTDSAVRARGGPGVVLPDSSSSD